MNEIAHWLYQFFGLDSGSGSRYLFWSGPGSDLGELMIVGGLYTFVRKHNCHRNWCPRVGRFPQNNWHYCRKHHSLDDPGQPPTHLESGYEYTRSDAGRRQ